MAEEVKGEINFQKVLFLHLNRTLQAAVTDPNMFISCVEAFHDVMIAYVDDLDLKTEEEELKKAMNLDRMFKDKDEQIDRTSIDLSRAKFRCLMRVAEEKGLLLGKTDYGYDEDE